MDLKRLGNETARFKINQDEDWMRKLRINLKDFYWIGQQPNYGLDPML